MRQNNFNKYLLLILLIVGPGTAFVQGGFGGVAEWLMETALVFPGIVIALSFHEFGHAKVAQLCGDRTPEYMGRVTLDPMAHIDLMGMVSLLTIHFGWGKPVVVNPLNYRNRKRGSLAVGFAGVGMNLLVAIVFSGIIKLLYMISPEFMIYNTFGHIIGQLIVEVVIINISLMFFNLLPVAPLDGFGIVCDIFNLNGSRFDTFMRNYSSLILLMFIIFEIPGKILSAPLSFTVNFLMGRVFSVPWYLFL